MGVHGITSLLKANGWLPSSTDGCRCSTALFREVQRQDSAAQQLLGLSAAEPSQHNRSLPSELSIPPGSTLWIDGNGLSFYVEAVAYARHARTVFANHPSLKNRADSDRCVTTAVLNKLSISQVNQLLPTVLPVEIVDSVVREYVDTLGNECGVTLKVVWDGPLRHPQKDDTMMKRTARTDEEWCNLQQYCEYGRLPRGKQQSNRGHAPSNSASCFCSCLKNEFPRARMTTVQVRHTLRKAGVEQINAEEEADIHLARQTTDDPTAYVVGQDSDFFFFRGIRYVPMDTISVGVATATQDRQRRQLSACVFERSVLAMNVLGFATERHMIDLAYLSGNDYLDGRILQQHYLANRSRANVIEFLQEQDEDFAVRVPDIEGTMKPDEARELTQTLNFIRAWYELESLDDFPFEIFEEDAEPAVVDLHSKRPSEDRVNDDDVSDSDVSATDDPDDDQEPDSIVLGLPDDFPIQLAIAKGEDRSLTSPVLRALQGYLEEELKDGDHLLDDDQVTAYLTLMCSSDSVESSVAARDRVERDAPNLRPRWHDVQACSIIESCIIHALKIKSNALLAASASPHTLFDAMAFYAYMAQKRSVDEVRAGAVDPSGHVAGENNEDAAIRRNEESAPKSVLPPRISLPIDEHEETILEHIRDNRITIIHGETGCGKSSRLPIMLLRSPPPDPRLGKVKFFISQPRRIAAKGLVERVRSCEPEFRDCFALRMGHGLREYESKQTQAWFVTTGYLTRLMANHPEKFDDCTHLIIDEVHERSVDTDILCFLCRRLLERNQTIRLILMSATMAASMYQEYFDVDNPPIHVGVRTFPITKYFVEDLHRVMKPSKGTAEAVRSIISECNKARCRTPPHQNGMKARFLLASRLATVVGRPGSSVLIFVPGMNEIVAITEEVDSLYVAGTRFTCVPIHSDIPFEDQMLAFDKPDEDEVKIVVATNAAESSVTLPDVDHVICLGLCRQIVYNAGSHRQMLVTSWISKASATQRAGRTGRVRPGNVYRLYTRDTYETHMSPFESGEMVRIPLDTVILMLKELLHEEVKPVLLDCIEPPKIDTIDRSFESLSKWNFISAPNDTADITTLGQFVSSSGIDLVLGFLVGLGIQFGVAAEAVEMAAALTFTKSPFKIANAMFHDPDEFNKITKESFIARSHFDANLYSEPLGLMNLMWDYDRSKHKTTWCRRFSVVPSRIKQLLLTRKNLRLRTATYLGINEEKLRVTLPPVHMPHAKITLLRVLQVWTFSDTLLQMEPSKLESQGDGSISISLEGALVGRSDMVQVLSPERHPFRFQKNVVIKQHGKFDVDLDEDDGIVGFARKIKERLLSYALESKAGAVVVQTTNSLDVYLVQQPHCLDEIGEFEEFCVNQYYLLSHNPIIGRKKAGNKLKGVAERPSGKWEMHTAQSADVIKYDGGIDANNKLIKRYSSSVSDKDFVGSISHELKSRILQRGFGTTMMWTFAQRGKKNKVTGRPVRISHPFQVTSSGECAEIKNVDLQDLLMTRTFTCSVASHTKKQNIVFQAVPNKPMAYSSGDAAAQATLLDHEASSWRRPMFDDVPEGARLLSVIASGQRKGSRKHRILITPSPRRTSSTILSADDDDDQSVEPVVIYPDSKTTDLRSRWRQMGSTKVAYVPESAIPVSAFFSAGPLFCCCSNTLDVHGGARRVEGLTLLPPSKLFVLLSAMTFGVTSTVVSGLGKSREYDEDEEPDNEKLIAWLDLAAMAALPTLQNGACLRLPDDEVEQRLQKAHKFHGSCMHLGEELVCFPDKVVELCEIFDMVDGYQVKPWTSLGETALTPENLAKWQYEKRNCITEVDDTGRADTVRQSNEQHTSRQSTNTKAVPSQRALQERLPQTPRIESPTVSAAPRKDTRIEVLRSMSLSALPNQHTLFATDLPAGENVGSRDLVSTNILSMVAKVYRALSEVKAGLAISIDNGTFQQCSIDLNSGSWTIYKITIDVDDGEQWYSAQFKNKIVPDRQLTGRGKSRVPKWMRNESRPQKVSDAASCVPPSIPVPECAVVDIGKKKSKNRVGFRDIDTAVRMEAAFWLEKYFCHAKKDSIRHWYDYTFPQMVEILREEVVA